MEDAYSFVVDFARVRGQGYFAVFDGHAGKYAAEWCGQHFHEKLLDQLRARADLPIPDIFNHTFHAVDTSLSELASQNDKMHSGCTAVTAFLRVEDAQGKQSFLQGLDFGSSTSNSIVVSPIYDALSSTSAVDGSNDTQPYPTPEPSQTSSSPSPDESPRSESPASGKTKKSGILKKGSQVVSAIKSLASPSPSGTVEKQTDISSSSTKVSVAPVGEAVTPPSDLPLRRVLYTANAGDARAVLCRAGRAVRLTYDHKGSDKQEAKRITDAGGFVMSGRVNGVLAVTRSLGDSSMKEFVVGSPYTTETELGEDDEFLILACDGVSRPHISFPLR